MTVREKYPTAKYDPDPECQKCKGTGDRQVEGRDLPCICIFIGDREFRKVAAEGLAKVARDIRREMDE